MRFLFQILFPAIFLVNTVLAQTPVPNELDKQYTPGQNSIFNSNAKVNNTEGGRSITEIKNAIKYNPFLLGRSTIAFFYERRIANRFNLQVGLGACKNTDKIQALFAEGDGFSLSTVNSTSLGFGDILNNSTFYRGGLFFSGGIRIFPNGYYSSGENFDGSYIEINYRYNAYNVLLNANPNGSSSRVQGTHTVKVQNNGLNMLFGSEFTTDGKIHTTHDFYIGVGFKNVGYNEFVMNTVEEIVGGYSNSVYQYTDSGKKLSISKVALLVGYSFGFGF